MDDAYENLSDEELRSARLFAERAATLADNQARNPGVSRERVLARVENLARLVDPPDLDGLKRALVAGDTDGARRHLDEAGRQHAARMAAGELVDVVRKWAANVDLDPDPSQQVWGAIRHETDDDLLAFVQEQQAERDRHHARAGRIREELEQRRQREEQAALDHRRDSIRRGAIHGH